MNRSSSKSRPFQEGELDDQPWQMTTFYSVPELFIKRFHNEHESTGDFQNAADKILNLRKILGVTKIFLKSRLICTMIVTATAFAPGNQFPKHPGTHSLSASSPTCGRQCACAIKGSSFQILLMEMYPFSTIPYCYRI